MVHGSDTMQPENKGCPAEDRQVVQADLLYIHSNGTFSHVLFLWFLNLYFSHRGITIFGKCSGLSSLLAQLPLK